MLWSKRQTKFPLSETFICAKYICEYKNYFDRGSESLKIFQYICGFEKCFEYELIPEHLEKLDSSSGHVEQSPIPGSY